MGYTFQASQYMNGYHFYYKSMSMGYLFHPKSIWMGKIWKIVYEWGQFSKKVYEWGQFSIWEVYEWVMFFTCPGIWMGWGSGTPAAHPYPKSWQVTPPCVWVSILMTSPLCVAVGLLSIIRRGFFLQILKFVSFWLHGRKPVHYTSWMTVVTPSDRRKSVRNRCA